MIFWVPDETPRVRPQDLGLAGRACDALEHLRVIAYVRFHLLAREGRS